MLKKTLYFGLAAVLALGLVGVLARPAAAEAVTVVWTGNGTSGGFCSSYGLYADLAPADGQQGWLFILTQPSGEVPTLTATFQQAGTISVDGYPAGGGGGSFHFVIYTPEDDQLLSASTTNGSTGSKLTVSHCETVPDLLSVSKNASTRYTMTYSWTIDKSVAPAAWALFAGEAGTSQYTVAVDRTLVEVWSVSGEITIFNPDQHYSSRVATVTDQLSDGQDLAVTCPVTLPFDLGPGQTLTCTYAGLLADGAARVNTATVATADPDRDRGGQATADVIFGEPEVYGFASINVTDTNGQTWAAGDDAVWTYPGTFDCSTNPGAYAGGHYAYNRPNTAAIDETGASDSADVSVDCYAPVVSKDASTSYTRTWNWDITKSVSPETLDMFTGDSGDVVWTVEWDKLGYTDSAFAVAGAIYVHNPAPMAMTLGGVADVVSQSGEEFSAPVTCPALTVEPGQTLVCSYFTSLWSAADGSNTATATMNGIGFTGSADVRFGDPTTVVDYEVTVMDEHNAAIGGLVSTSGSASYGQTFTCDGDEGRHTNTATILETGDFATAAATVNCYGLQVTKDASTSLTRTWTWSIDKSADQTSLLLAPGQQFQVNYAVALGAASADSNWAVAGGISVHNPAPIAAELTDVADEISGGEFAVNLNCGVSFPYTLAAGATLNCSYTAGLPDAAARTNTATATLQNKPAGTTAFSGSAPVSFAAPAVTKVDECVTVTDTLQGALGTVCASDAPRTFTYALWFGHSLSADVYLECGLNETTNIASFVTGDTGQTGSDSWTVISDAACATGCSLTPGYWKTHSSYGPARYDDAWAQIGENTPFFQSGTSWYGALWTNPQGNAYWILAHAYIAARLNQVNGADTSAIDSQLAQAAALFNFYTPEGVAAAKGKSGNALRSQFVSLASVLDTYNNGYLGPGHCSE